MEARYLPPIIGFTGKAGAGKDTLAACAARFDYIRYSLADPIKDLLNARFDWDQTWWDDRDWKENARYGGFSPRSWAQWLGTEVGRHLAGEDVWVDALLAKAAANGHAKRCVIPDVRFNNEAKKIQDMGGIVVYVDRYTAPVARHVSERGVDDLYIDYEINNNGSVEESDLQLRQILERWEKDFGIHRA